MIDSNATSPVRADTLVIHWLTFVMESDEDEDDVIGLDIFDIHDKRSLTPEETILDPKLQKILDDFGLMHSYLNDPAPSWTAEDHMASIEKKMTECKLKLDVDYYGCTVKDGTQPVIHRPPIEDVVFIEIQQTWSNLFLAYFEVKLNYNSNNILIGKNVTLLSISKEIQSLKIF